jgi:hypothetical protein
LESVPEIFLIIRVGFILFNIDIDWKKSLVISLGGGLVSYIVRMYITIFGVHTILIMIAIIILIRLVLKTNFIYAGVGILTGTLITGILQLMVTPLLLAITDKNMNDLCTEPWLSIMFFIPCALLMLLLYVIVKKNCFYLIDFNGSVRMDRNDKG